MKIFTRWFLVVLASVMLVGNALQGAGQANDRVRSYIKNRSDIIRKGNFGKTAGGKELEQALQTLEADIMQSDDFSDDLHAVCATIDEVVGAKFNVGSFNDRYADAQQEFPRRESSGQIWHGRRLELERTIEWGNQLADEEFVRRNLGTRIDVSKTQGTLHRLVSLDIKPELMRVDLAQELAIFTHQLMLWDGDRLSRIDALIDPVIERTKFLPVADSATNQQTLRTEAIAKWLKVTLNLFELQPQLITSDYAEAFIRFVARASTFNDGVKRRILSKTNGATDSNSKFFNGQYTLVQIEAYACALLLAGYADAQFLRLLAPYVSQIGFEGILSPTLLTLYLRALLSRDYLIEDEIIRSFQEGMQYPDCVVQLLRIHNLKYLAAAARDAVQERARAEEAQRRQQLEQQRAWETAQRIKQMQEDWERSAADLRTRVDSFKKRMEDLFAQFEWNDELWGRYMSFQQRAGDLQYPTDFATYEQELVNFQAELQVHEQGVERAKQQALMDARERFRNYLEQVYQQVSSTISGTEVIDFGDGDFQIVQARQQAMRQEAHHISVDFWAEQGAFNTADIASIQGYYTTIQYTHQQIAQMIVDLNQELNRRYAERIEEARRAEEEARLEQDRQEQRRAQEERMRLEEEQRRQQEEALRLEEERRQEEARLEAQRQENLRQIRAQIGVISRAKAIGSAWKRKAQNSITAKRVAEEARLKREEQLRAEQEAAQRKEAARLRKQAADKERAEKLQKMKQGQAATKIQAQMRGFVARQKYGRALAEKRSEEEAIRQQETRRREELERKKQAEQAAAVAVAVQAKKAPVPAPRRQQPVAESLPLLRHAETQQYAFGPTQAGWQGGKETAAADADAARLKKLEELDRQKQQQGTEGTRQVSDLERGLAEINAERDWKAEMRGRRGAQTLKGENQARYINDIVRLITESKSSFKNKLGAKATLVALLDNPQFKEAVEYLNSWQAVKSQLEVAGVNISTILSIDTSVMDEMPQFYLDYIKDELRK